MNKKLYFVLLLTLLVSVRSYADDPCECPEEPDCECLPTPIDPGSGSDFPAPPPGLAPISSYEWVLFTGAILLGSYKMTQNIKNKKSTLK